MSLLNLQNYKEVIQNLIEKFFALSRTSQDKYIKAAALTQSKEVRLCSDPFLIFLELHKKQSQLSRRTERQLAGDGSDIGVFSCNVHRAESGEEPSDPTRFRAGDGNQNDSVLAEAKALWKRMSPDLKLPFFVEAFLAVHVPEALDQAL